MPIPSSTVDSSAVRTLFPEAEEGKEEAKSNSDGRDDTYTTDPFP